MTEVPTLTTEQRHAALEKAMTNRKKQAAFLKDVSSGKMSIAEALANTGDPIIGATRVKSLIKAMPSYGETKALKLMDKIGIAESRRLQGLGIHQREALIAIFGRASKEQD